MKKCLDNMLPKVTKSLGKNLDEYWDIFTIAERSKIYKAMIDGMWEAINQIEKEENDKETDTDSGAAPQR